MQGAPHPNPKSKSKAQLYWSVFLRLLFTLANEALVSGIEQYLRLSVNSNKKRSRISPCSFFIILMALSGLPAQISDMIDESNDSCV